MKKRLDNFYSTRVERSGEAFVLATSYYVMFLGFCVICVGFLDLCAVVVKSVTGDFTTADTPGIIAAALVVGVFLIIWSLIFMTRSFRFDRTKGTLTARALFRKCAELPLSEIVAVQCLYFAQGSAKGGRWDIWQLNVVAAKGKISRIGITLTQDEAWLHETVAELASFLNVPVVDQIAASKAAYEANRFKLWW